MNNITLAFFSLVLCGCSAGNAYYTAEDFARVPKIDAHVHIYSADTGFIHQAKADNFRVMTIAVEEPPGMELQEQLGITHSRRFPGTVAFAGTISLAGWNEPGWLARTQAHLQSMIDAGAVAIKFYKTIGMELKDTAGQFVMVDHPRFDTLADFLAGKNIPVVGHIAEPMDCWRPLKEMRMNTHRRYYTKHPGFHMYAHPEYPGHGALIAARDSLVRRHPKLLFIGAHLGSLEWDTDTLAMHLDHLPNMAVDMAARISDLQYQTMHNREKVRAFFIRYQDRLLYGTDRSADNDKPSAEAAKFAHEAWLHDWAFFTSADTLRSPAFDGAFTGLQLPKAVVDKIYRKNAERWLPGLAR